MSATNCATCDNVLQPDDNYCRQCGAAQHEAGLPAPRPAMAVTLWRPQASPVVKGAAVMAAGTIGQFVVRKALGSLLSGGSRKRRRLIPALRRNDGLVDEAQIITETVMMRRVRIRRPA